MNEAIIEKAAVQFGTGVPKLELLGNGLIHKTYKVSFSGSPAIVLQCINQNTFPQPENIINNYLLMQEFLREQHQQPIPALVPAHQGKHYYWVDPNGNYWRATHYQENSFAPAIAETAVQAHHAAKAFASFTRSLKGLPAEALSPAIPGFHDLTARYASFESIVKKAHISRLLKSTHVISEIRDRGYLLDFYQELSHNESAYPTRIMHHDCKVSNILFDRSTQAAICPVDLDTVMPGKFFSDLGDMIRTMACSEEENSNSWETIDVRPEFYHAITNGYLEGMGGDLTTQEIKHLHKAGLLMTYMQCIRFAADFLNNDIYYKTTYPEQNLNRALNQLIFLEKLEAFIERLDGQTR